MQLISEAGQSSAKPAETPLELNQKILSKEFSDFTGSDTDLLEDASGYQRLIGRLLYLTMTRPDISYAVQSLSQFMHAPTKVHYNAALRIVRYLKQSPGMGILMPAVSNNSLSAFCDADWAACPESRKSITGYVVKYGEALISWKSKKQATVSRSTAESEFRSMAATVSEIVWIVALFKDLGISLTLPVDLYCDNRAALHIASNPMFHERTKHIDVDCHFVRERINQGVIRTAHVNTKFQVADILTKSLPQLSHSSLISQLGLINIFSESVHSPSVRSDKDDIVSASAVSLCQRRGNINRLNTQCNSLTAVT